MELTIWKEYSTVFETARYNVYDAGHHLKGFDTEEEALKYVQSLESIKPRKEQVLNTYGNYRIVKYFSYNYLTYRFRTEVVRSVRWTNQSYYDFDQSFETRSDAIARISDLTANENSCCKSDNEPEQIYPYATNQ